MELGCEDFDVSIDSRGFQPNLFSIKFRLQIFLTFQTMNEKNQSHHCFFLNFECLTVSKGLLILEIQLP